ncbi:EH signature protein [Volucribacter psittacicida]|uniref:EH signature protein n=1 Tax=Volucribacter psittacicida TaxID=203482 RepID=A0A4R1FN41_9PAST|nr:EH signature domain-containing protein [Volucribacter psittacicida]TCJ94804.1 EH signature protein [Volucribacter psittacicida]
MKLPKLSISIRPWSENDFTQIKQSIVKLKELNQKVLNFNHDEIEYSQKIIEKLNRYEDITHILQNSADIRVITKLLCLNLKFVQRIHINHILLEHLLTISNPISKLSLINLINSFFKFYNHYYFKNKGNFNLVCDFIVNQLNLHIESSKNKLVTLSCYYDNAHLLFCRDADLKLVNYAEQHNIDFEQIIQKFGLENVRDGDFIERCYHKYYLEKLKSIPIGKNHSVLAEIVKEQVVIAKYDENSLLGHKILEILIDRSAYEDKGISAYWKNIVLEIAGDPRIQGEKYRRWWSFLGEKRIQLMKSWLSGDDLKVFLSILEQSAKDKHNSDMERMFKPRKCFMEGLLRSGVILESRLFLTQDASHYVKQYYPQQARLMSFANVSGHASIIYLKLKTSRDNQYFHLIEGTHSFKLKLMSYLPSEMRITDYSKKYYDLNNFYGIAPIELTHDIHLNWQKKAIDEFKNVGIKIDPSDVLSDDDYYIYKHKFGIRY